MKSHLGQLSLNHFMKSVYLYSYSLIRFFSFDYQLKRKLLYGFGPTSLKFSLCPNAHQILDVIDWKQGS